MRSADGQEGKRAQQNRSANEARGKRRPGKARGAAEEPSAQGCREERSTREKKRREAKDREDQPERRGKNASGRHGTKRHERGTTGCRTKSLENGSNDVPAGKPGQRGQDRNYEPQPRKWCGTGAGTALEGCGNGEAADKRIGSPRKRRSGRRNRTRPRLSPRPESWPPDKRKAGIQNRSSESPGENDVSATGPPAGPEIGTTSTSRAEAGCSPEETQQHGPESKQKNGITDQTGKASPLPGRQAQNCRSPARNQCSVGDPPCAPPA